MDTSSPNPPVEFDPKLHNWHLECFRELGFKRYQAEVLELAGLLPHDVDDLLKAGCPAEIELLIDILT